MRIVQDLAALEKRFYELSRAAHPDRFASSGQAELQRASLERMSLLNEAYRTLRDRDLSREYLLKLEGVLAAGATAPSGVPAELAEDWFELQESVLESPEEAATRLEQFGAKLRALQEAVAAELLENDARIDASIESSGGISGRPERKLLDAALAAIQRRSYLRSMERDLQRIQSRNLR